jgi:hypothetical protein
MEFRHLCETTARLARRHPNVGFKIIEYVRFITCTCGAAYKSRIDRDKSTRERTVFFVPSRANCNESSEAIYRSIANDGLSISAIVYLREEVIVDLHAAIGEQLREMSGRTDEEVVAHNLRYRPLILEAVFYLIPIGILEQREQR